jgi:hypothetical protein
MIKKIPTIITIIFLLALNLSNSTLSYGNQITKDSNYPISVDKIWFNYGETSNAITIKDCETGGEPIETPEYLSNRINNPSAYIKGSTVTIKVQFHNKQFYSGKIKATGSLGGLTENEVTIHGYSDWINFTVIETLEDKIKTYDISWDWYYYNTEQEDWSYMETTEHVLYGLNKKPLHNWVFLKLANWTTQWCEQLPVEEQENDKSIADAILNGFATDKYIKYGQAGWTVCNILKSGGGMCGGMKEVFHYACAAQGVYSCGICYILDYTFYSYISPENLWRGIVIKDPGLGRDECSDFGARELTWPISDNVYPNPRYYQPIPPDIDNPNDDCYKAEPGTKAYVFYENDGHCVNLLEYDNDKDGVKEVYLYDLSFGKGPFSDTFNKIPTQGTYTSKQLSSFRENYHDSAIDYLLGIIYYKNEQGEKRININYPFCIKTSIIPHELNGFNQLLYNIYIHEYKNKAKAKTLDITEDIKYIDSLKDVIKSDYLPSINFEEKKLVESWVKNPSNAVDWLDLRNAVLKLGKARSLRDKIYSYVLLKEILNVNTEINTIESQGLPGIMSPLDMVKSSARAAFSMYDSPLFSFVDIIQNMFNKGPVGLFILPFLHKMIG